MCGNEGRVGNVRCDTETWRMWESQPSRSKHFSPTLFSSTEVKVFCILMRISDAQRSHPESFTIRHEDICLSGRSYLFGLPQATAVFVILPLTFSLSAPPYSQQLICLLWQTTKTFTHHNDSSTSALEDLGTKCFSGVAENKLCPSERQKRQNAAVRQ